MSELKTSYHFVPAVRRGLATAIARAAGGERAELNVRLHASASGSTNDVDQFDTKVQLYGPGDIVGFDSRIVTRTDPRPNVGDFEPNFFPFIEFADPDFPWRYTAAPGNDTGLRPWITLIVLEENEFDDKQYKQNTGTPSNPEVPWIIKEPAGKLPDLKEAWRWAHVQVTADSGLVLNETKFADFDASAPEQVVSRLVCARRLKPGTAYEAFVVPTFKLGCVAAGRAVLDEDHDTALTLAWDKTAGEVQLPYYYRWKFHTGQRGDFEYLVRLLERRRLTDLGKRPMDCFAPGYGMPPVERPDHVLQLEGGLKSVGLEYTQWGADDPPGDPTPLQKRLATELLNKSYADLAPRTVAIPLVDSGIIQDLTVTLRPVVFGGPGNIVVRMEGHLRWTTAVSATCTLGGPLAAYSDDTETQGTIHEVALSGLEPRTTYQFEITAVDEEGRESTASNLAVATPAFPLPTVVPPIYGRWHAGRLTVRTDGGAWVRNDEAEWVRSDQYPWIDELNLDPRHRVAAGFGALVVERQQEALMASAWDQLGQIEDANEVLRRAQLGREAADAIFKRLGAFAPGDFLRATRAVHKRVRIAVPWQGGAVSTVQRYFAQTRIPAAAFDPALRRVRRRRGPLRKKQRPPSGDAIREMLERLDDGSLRAAGPAQRPDGMVGLCDVTTVIAPLELPQPPDDSGGVHLGTLTGVGTTGGTVSPGVGTGPSGTVGPGVGTVVVPTPQERFCEEFVTCQRVKEALSDPSTLQGIPLPRGVTRRNLESALCGVLDGWLKVTPAAPVAVPHAEIDRVIDVLKQALDPRKTIAERVKQRLNLAKDLPQRKDDLEPVVASPEFPQPMYEPLRDISQDLILPGVERVPQNTLAVLETNGRFVESYMVALNHAFTGELFWRGAPVSGRATYFRQFWDVDAAVPTDDFEAIARATVPADEPDPEAWVATEIKRLEKEYREKLKDIKSIHLWGNTPLGDNDNRATTGQGEQLVLLVRGDLLKKYPNTLVYAIPADETQGNLVPALKEFLPANATTEGPRIFPVFSGTLPPDLNFFGFAFTAYDALGRHSPTGVEPAYLKGVYFVLEERVSEARFGMDDWTDEQDPPPVTDWDNLTWGHLPTVGEGAYIDDAEPDDPNDILDPSWNTSSAAIAHITLQKPVRIAVHADQMLP